MAPPEVSSHVQRRMTPAAERVPAWAEAQCTDAEIVASCRAWDTPEHATTNDHRTLGLVEARAALHGFALAGNMQAMLVFAKLHLDDGHLSPEAREAARELRGLSPVEIARKLRGDALALVGEGG